MDRFRLGMKNLLYLPPKFPSVYRSVCNLTSEDGKKMRELVAQKCATNLQQIVTSKNEDKNSSKGIKACETWSEVLEDDGDMAFSVLKCISKQHHDEKSRLKEENIRLNTRLQDALRYKATRQW